MGLAAIKGKKGLAENEQLFDRAGRSELAANFFRAAQAAERIGRLQIKGQQNANETHEKVGREVRNTIKNLGNMMPEELPAAPHIRTIQKKNKTAKQIAQTLLLPTGDGSIAGDTLTGSGA